ncbi:hypothetical protein Tco_0974026 [Tanacetum coccineum]|uniref:Uncharacterized protein n=1 Tax=Tanacetum coccineum TaxID=301880 RepID=A0ABQ5EAF0_9ASTR
MWGWRGDGEGVAIMGVAVVEGDSGEGGCGRGVAAAVEVRRSGWIGFVVTDVGSAAGGRNSSGDGAGKDGGGEVCVRVL